MVKWLAILVMLFSFISNNALAVLNTNENTVNVGDFKKSYPTLRYEDAIVEMAKPLDIKLNNERYLFTCHVYFGSISKSEYARFYSIFRYIDAQWVEIKKDIVNTWDASTYYRNSMPKIELIEYKGQKFIRYASLRGRSEDISLYSINDGKASEISWDIKRISEITEKQLQNNEEIGLFESHPEFKDNKITEIYYVMNKANNCSGCEPVANIIITYDIVGNKIVPLSARRIESQKK